MHVKDLISIVISFLALLISIYGVLVSTYPKFDVAYAIPHIEWRNASKDNGSFKEMSASIDITLINKGNRAIVISNARLSGYESSILAKDINYTTDNRNKILGDVSEVIKKQGGINYSAWFNESDSSDGAFDKKWKVINPQEVFVLKQKFSPIFKDGSDTYSFKGVLVLSFDIIGFDERKRTIEEPIAIIKELSIKKNQIKDNFYLNTNSLLKEDINFFQAKN